MTLFLLRFTEPQVACVGLTETAAREQGRGFITASYPFADHGKSLLMEAKDGFVKLLADKRTDRVLGVHIVGADAGEMIHEAVLCMEFGGSAEDLARTCHAHPTMSEAVKEAAMAVDKRPIHI